jgi:hypothetical protein
MYDIGDIYHYRLRWKIDIIISLSEKQKKKSNFHYHLHWECFLLTLDKQSSKCSTIVIFSNYSITLKWIVIIKHKNNKLCAV